MAAVPGGVAVADFTWIRRGANATVIALTGALLELDYDWEQVVALREQGVL